MALDFQLFRDELIAHFEKNMCEGSKNLFRVGLDTDKLWELYLNSIPGEDNKIFRTRPEYDCSCCRHFIKSVGNIVAIKDNKLVSIWDFTPTEPKWSVVANELSNFVKQHKVSEIFLTNEGGYGTKRSLVDLDGDGNITTFSHFYIKVPDFACLVRGTRRRQSSDTLGTALGDYRDRYSVFKRSLEELSRDSVETVLELIKQGSLYRGEEFKGILERFYECKKAYEKLSVEEKDLYCWSTSADISTSVSKIRNTSIGTLLTNISEGMPLDEAVGKYEAVVAPTNYKRSKPIFTQRMLDDAQKTITGLGYLESLQRRYANADDISVNNILFSNKDVAKRIKGGAANIFEELSKETKNAPNKFSKVEEIPIDKFIDDVLPTATGLEVYLENRHYPNLVSLIAPVVPDSKSMFKWNNNFSWAYAGNVTDSLVKQNVKNAGGNVEGVLRFSIQWNDLGEFDANDEDAHCIEPKGNHIYYGDKSNRYTGGNLDVDIIHPERGKAAVENITWPDIHKMEDGVYSFYVNCYSCRGGRSGFRAEVEFDGQIYSFDYNKPLRQSENVNVANVTLKDGKFSIEELLPSNVSSREMWGLKTNEFVPVVVVSYSPNYWDSQNGVGNKHYFFMLKGCVNPELPNAWYNEFLNDELYPAHRKVMEAMASKAHVQDTEDQLSGLGFSSTLRNDLVVKVVGSTERLLKIKF